MGYQQNGKCDMAELVLQEPEVDEDSSSSWCGNGWGFMTYYTESHRLSMVLRTKEKYMVNYLQYFANTKWTFFILR